MKLISTLTFLILFFKLFGQYGLNRYPEIYPKPDMIIVGYPSLEYFKRFGDTYVLTHTIQDPYDSTEYDFFKSFYRLHKNKIRVKTISSITLFPTIRKYKIEDNAIKECNRFGKERKNRELLILEKSKIEGSDSIVYRWEYSIKKGDTTWWRSYRKLFDLNRQLIKREVALMFYAESDSTWKIAETFSPTCGVERTKFQHLSENEVKVTLESSTAKYYNMEDFMLTFTYDDLGNLVEIKNILLRNNYTRYFRFTYDNGLCVSYELRDSVGTSEKSVVTK